MANGREQRWDIDGYFKNVTCIQSDSGTEYPTNESDEILLSSGTVYQGTKRTDVVNCYIIVFPGLSDYPCSVRIEPAGHGTNRGYWCDCG
jgi:hypothetical protein